MLSSVCLVRFLVVIISSIIALTGWCATAKAQSELPTPTAISRFEKPAWLEGTGADLRMQVSGEVFEDDNKPATDFEITAVKKFGYQHQDLNLVVDGHRFSVWVPVGTLQWFSVTLKAATEDGRQIANRTISDYQLRQAAIDGVALTMQRTQRTVTVHVLDHNKPVTQAIVTAELQVGDDVTAVTDAHGTATLNMMVRDRLRQLTARTNDFRIGGFAFNRDPPRDTAGSEFTVSLEKCRQQKVRLVDSENGLPISDIGFYLEVGTGPPDYQYIGKTPDSRLKTNQDGEAVYRWFPDWKHHGAYATVLDERWVKAGEPKMVDGVLESPLKRSLFAERKRVAGRINSEKHNPAGMCVNIHSFQGEIDGYTDVMHAVADENGIFYGNYLPGATYCIAVNDEQWVSKIIDLIPWEPKSKTLSEPELTLEEGRAVEVILTSGPRKRPIPYQSVQLETEHNYSCMENGKEKFCGGSRRWWVLTNRFGRAFTYALGEHEVKGSVYSPEWRSKQKIDVTTDGPNRLRIHREFDTPRKVFGRLIPPENIDCDLADAVIEIRAVDGETKERLSVTANADGTYSFDSKSLQVALFVHTKDGKAAAAVSHLDLEEPANVQLLATTDFHGQLLDRNDQPVASHRVMAAVRVYGERNENRQVMYPQSAESKPMDATTDDQGNFTIRGISPKVQLILRSAAFDGSKNLRQIGNINLDDNHDRPRQVFKISRRAED